MSGKPFVIAKLKYIKPGAHTDLRNYLKYLQYRDGSVRRDAYKRGETVGPDLSDYVKPDHREATWVDHGLGSSYKTITKNCYNWQGRSVMARSWIVSPDPQLMQHIPEQLRFDVMSRTVENTMQSLYGDAGWGDPEYAYVVHDKHLVKKDTDQTQQMVHAHIITPGTIPVDSVESRGRIDHYMGKHQIAHMKQVSERAFEKEMERVLGKDRTREIFAERDRAIAEQRRRQYLEKKGIDPDTYDAAQKAKKEAEAKAPPKLDKRGLAGLNDMMTLIKREKERKKRQKDGKKQADKRRQHMEDVRIYSRLRSREAQNRQEEDARDARRAWLAEQAQAREERQQAQQQRDAAIQAAHEKAIAEGRAKHEAQVEKIKAKGYSIKTYGERHGSMNDDLAIQTSFHEHAQRVTEHVADLTMPAGISGYSPNLNNQIDEDFIPTIVPDDLPLPDLDREIPFFALGTSAPPSTDME